MPDQDIGCRPESRSESHLRISAHHTGDRRTIHRHLRLLLQASGKDRFGYIDIPPHITVVDIQLDRHRNSTDPHSVTAVDIDQISAAVYKDLTTEPGTDPQTFLAVHDDPEHAVMIKLQFAMFFRPAVSDTVIIILVHADLQITVTFQTQLRTFRHQDTAPRR